MTKFRLVRMKIGELERREIERLARERFSVDVIARTVYVGWCEATSNRVRYVLRSSSVSIRDARDNVRQCMEVIATVQRSMRKAVLR